MKLVTITSNTSESACADKDLYISKYGPHFNAALCNYATSLMIKNGKPLEVCSKEQVDKLLTNYGLILNHNKGWDYVFVANMGKADYLNSSIPDEKHLAWYIKDTIDDEDASEGTTLYRWCATMKANQKSIDWKHFI